MANKPRTPERYQAVLDAYWALGVHHTAVAERVHMHRDTVFRLYTNGWPDKGKEQYPPIRDRLHTLLRAQRVAVEEGKPATKKEVEAKLSEAKRRLAEADEKARQRLAAADAEARVRLNRAEVEAQTRLQELLARAKVDATETLADEANAAKFQRKATLQASGLVAMVLRDAQTWAGQIRQGMDLSTLPPLQRLQAGRMLVRLVEAMGRALLLALQAERLRVGQPTEVLGVTALDASLEEREAKLAAVSRALARRRERHLQVVPASPVVGVEAAPEAQAALPGGTGENQAGGGQESR